MSVLRGSLPFAASGTSGGADAPARQIRLQALFPAAADRLAGLRITLRYRLPPPGARECSGVGLVLVLGLGLIAIGLLFMLWQRSRDPAFFRGETLVKDTPALVVED